MECMIADQKHHTAEDPGDGVCPGDSFQTRPEGERQSNIADPDDTPAHQHGTHGDGGSSGTPENSGHTVGKGHEKVKKADGAHMPGAIIYNLRRIVENLNQLRCQQVCTDANEFRQNQTANDTEANACLDPAILLGTNILAHKGGKGLGETDHRQKGEAFQLGIGAAASHGSRTEAIDAALHHHVGYRDHRILDTGGQAEANDGGETAAMEPDRGRHQTVYLL